MIVRHEIGLFSGFGILEVLAKAAPILALERSLPPSSGRGSIVRGAFENSRGLSFVGSFRTIGHETIPDGAIAFHRGGSGGGNK